MVWSSGTPALTLKPATGQVTALALHPSKLEIGAFGYNNGSINIVNLLSGHVIARLTNSTGDIQSMAFSPSNDDTALLAYTSKDKSTGIVAIGTDSAKLLRSKRSNKSEGSDSNRYWAAVCWLDSDTLLVSKPSGDIFQLDKDLNMHKWAHVSSRTIFQLVPSTDSNSLACIAMDRKISAWDTKKKSRIWELSTLGGYVYQMAESPVDKSLIAMACGDNSVRVWCSYDFFSGGGSVDSNVSKRAKTVSSSLFSTSLLWKGISAKVTCICWSTTSTDQLLFGMDDGRLVLHSLENSHSATFQRGHKQAVYGVSFLNYNASRTDAHAMDVDADLEPVMASVGSDGEVLLHASPSSCIELNRAILAKSPAVLAALSASFGKALKALPRRTCFDFSLEHNRLILGNADGTIELYTWPMLQLCYSGRPHERLLNKVKWHPSIPSIAFTASEDGSICIFEFNNSFDAASVSRLIGHTKSVYDLAASKVDPKLLASSSADGTVRIWDIGIKSEIGYHRPTPNSHPTKLFSVLWSSYNENTILFGGDDQSVSVRSYSSSTPKIAEDVKPPSSTVRTRSTQESHKRTENPERRVKASSTARPLAQLQHVGSRTWITSDPLQLVSSWLSDSENSLAPVADPTSLHEAEQALHSEFLDGEDISETILKVVQAGKLNDAWVAWSASGGFPLWRNTCATYASILATKNDITRSVHYYCAIRDFDKAILVFEKANLFQDAIALASSRLPTGHPRIKSTWINWANHLAHRCQHPQAARSFVAAGEYEAAVAQLQMAASAESLLLAARLLASHCTTVEISRRDDLFWEAVALSINADSELSFLSPLAMESLSTTLDLVSSASRYLFIVILAIWHALRRDCGSLPKLSHRPTEAGNVAEMAYLIGCEPSYASSIGFTVPANDLLELETSMAGDLCLPLVTSLSWNLALSAKSDGEERELEEIVHEVLNVDSLLAARTSSHSLRLVSHAIPLIVSAMLPLDRTDAVSSIRGLCLIALQGLSIEDPIPSNLSRFHRLVFSYLSQTSRARSAANCLLPESELHLCWKLLTLGYDTLLKDASADFVQVGGLPAQSEHSTNALIALLEETSKSHLAAQPEVPTSPPSNLTPHLLALAPNSKKRPADRDESAADGMTEAKRHMPPERSSTTTSSLLETHLDLSQAEPLAQDSPTTGSDVHLLQQIVTVMRLRLADG